MTRKAKKKRAKKPIFKKWWFWIIVVVFLFIFLGSKGNQSEQINAHIYDNAQVKDVLNGSRTEKIGEYSIININSEKITDEALEDWYFNYVVKNDYNWYIILYTDKDDNLGIFANKGFVIKDTLLNQDEYGDYMLGDDPNATMYVPTDDGRLKISESSE